MIKFEDVVTPSPEQWKATIMGARNPLNSWNRSDSKFHEDIDFDPDNYPCGFKLGPNDYDLLKRLRNAGTADHRKFMRMLPVMVTITAPLYWWKEFDAYKVGTVTNSCSTMHKIADKEFTLEDFSTEHLIVENDVNHIDMVVWLQKQIDILNEWRRTYLDVKDSLTSRDSAKKYWWQMIQLLPSSYNQKRTVMMNYEVLANMYKSRKNHKLDEWREHDNIDTKTLKRFYDGNYKLRDQKSLNDIGFCDWIKTLPYAELITGEKGESKK